MTSLGEDAAYRVLDIVRGTTVDGPGFRTAVYLAGCRHDCPGCHNPQSHDPQAGKLMKLAEIMAIVEEEGFDVTLTGGDPLYHAAGLLPLLDTLCRHGRGVWLYTGYTWEQIISSPALLDAIRRVDVVVDGPFIQSLHDRDLLFRGSSNQRLIAVSPTLSEGKIHLWHP